MRRCKDCKRCNSYIERDVVEYDPAYGWCEAKKKDVGVIVWKCLLWASKLILLALILGGCGTTIRYNPETGEVYYHSDTGKEFSDLSIIKQANGNILIEVNKYKGEGIGSIVEGAVRGAIQGIK